MIKSGQIINVPSTKLDNWEKYVEEELVNEIYTLIESLEENDNGMNGEGNKEEEDQQEETPNPRKKRKLNDEKEISEFYFENDDNGMKGEVNEEGSEEEQEEIYEVKRIVGKKVENGKLFYKVNWKGYESSSDTWEPFGNLTNALEAVQDYEESILMDWNK